MKYIKYIWLWLTLPFIFRRNKYKSMITQDKIGNRRWGYHMNLKTQKTKTKSINSQLERGHQVCLSELLHYDTLNVISCEDELDYEELKSELEQLMSTCAYTYVNLKKPAIVEEGLEEEDTEENIPSPDEK